MATRPHSLHMSTNNETTGTATITRKNAPKDDPKNDPIDNDQDKKEEKSLESSKEDSPTEKARQNSAKSSPLKLSLDLVVAPSVVREVQHDFLRYVLLLDDFNVVVTDGEGGIHEHNVLLALLNGVKRVGFEGSTFPNFPEATKWKNDTYRWMQALWLGFSEKKLRGFSNAQAYTPTWINDLKREENNHTEGGEWRNVVKKALYDLNKREKKEQREELREAKKQRREEKMKAAKLRREELIQEEQEKRKKKKAYQTKRDAEEKERQRQLSQEKLQKHRQEVAARESQEEKQLRESEEWSYGLFSVPLVVEEKKEVVQDHYSSDLEDYTQSLSDDEDLDEFSMQFIGKVDQTLNNLPPANYSPTRSIGKSLENLGYKRSRDSSNDNDDDDFEESSPPPKKATKKTTDDTPSLDKKKIESIKRMNSLKLDRWIKNNQNSAYLPFALQLQFDRKERKQRLTKNPKVIDLTV